MTSKKHIPPEALEKLKAVRELTLRGVGGEKENAKKIYRRKLDEHGLSESDFEGAHRAELPEMPGEEPLPSGLRTIYTSGEVMVILVAGSTAHLVRERTVGVLVRNGTLTLAGAGTVTVTLAAPFRTLYSSGSGKVSVSGFSFKDVGFYHSGSGGLTVAGDAVHATLAPSGNAVVNATLFPVSALKITASGKSALRATGRTVCLSASGHAVVQAVATRSASVTVDAGARVTVSGCPVAGRRPPSGLGKVRWA